MFLSLLGAFQGDCLSGCLFTLVLAGALCELREQLAATMVRPNPPITIEGFPLETEYADDVDFMDEDEENLRKILPMATEILKSWNLFVNEEKTDFTRVYLANSREEDTNGNPLAGGEEWRKSITLGSMLCSKADIQRRISLGYAAFNLTTYNRGSYTYIYIWDFSFSGLPGLCIVITEHKEINYVNAFHRDSASVFQNK